MRECMLVEKEARAVRKNVNGLENYSGLSSRVAVGINERRYSVHINYNYT